jgi:hypothetical protein
MNRRNIVIATALLAVLGFGAAGYLHKQHNR